MNCLYDHYSDIRYALAKYHTVCAAAVLSEIDYHAAYLLDDTGVYRDESGRVYREIYDRREDPLADLYVTIENQMRPDGSKGLLYDSFDNLPQGQQKYHYICAAASVSEIPYHAAFLIREDGVFVDQAIWDRRVDPDATPEPEPEEEETPVEEAGEGGEA